MNTKETPSNFLDDEREMRDSGILDIKRFLFRIYRNWHFVFLSFLISIAVAFLLNRYTTKVYSVTASIIIKESTETSEAKLIYNNPLVSFSRNYLNELYIIRSYPLIEEVLRDVNFGVAFYNEGQFKTSEIYHSVPVDVKVISYPSNGGRLFGFLVENQDQYQLKYTTEENSVSESYSFGDTVTIDNAVFTIDRRHRGNFKEHIGIPYILSLRDPSNLTPQYVNRLKADWTEAGSGVIDLSINGPTPLKEIDFLNGLVSKFQEYDLNRKNQTALRTIEFIDYQLQNISDSLSFVERQLEVFKDKNVTTDLSSEALRVLQKIEALGTERAQIRLRQNYFKYLDDYIKTGDNLNQVILPASVGVSDDILTGLVGAMVQLQQEIKLFVTRENVQNPLIAAKRRKLDEVRQDVEEAIRNLRATDKIKSDFVNSQINELEGQLNRLPSAERRLLSIQRNFSLLDNLYVFLMQKRAEAEISRAANTSDVVLVNPAMVAGGPIAPNVRKNYVMAGLIGLAVPVLFFLLVEILNSKIQSREDIERLTGIPFVGGIGHKKHRSNLVVYEKPKSAVSEAFRALRSNLNYFTAGSDKKIFLVTSSISGEGKSFTTINLATVYALSEKKTIIIGADLRKPKIYGDFQLNNRIGLSNFLSGMASKDELVQRTGVSNLDFISSGPVPPNPSELLLSPKMKELLEWLLLSYEYIIIDSPPVALVADAFVLSALADHNIFVVRQNYTPKAVLKIIEEYYSSGRISKISLLMNDIAKTGPGYGYGYAYGYGYTNGYGYGESSGYYEEDDDKPQPFFKFLKRR